MKKKSRIIKAFMIIAFAALFGFIIVSSNIKQSKILCTTIKIDIKDKNELQFIVEKDILKIVNSSDFGSIINKKISDIDLENIEKQLEKNSYIYSAEVYSNFEGAIKIDIVQKKPLYRVINNNNVSYYISNKGYKIPLSTNFTANRIITTGHIPNIEEISSNKVNSDLKKLIDFIYKNTFWNAMISQVEVKQNGDFVLIPKLKGHTVLFGSIENIDSKFNKLKMFYQKGLSKTDWKKYKEINLKYKGQLICSK